jgi:hypothetical protein
MILEYHEIMYLILKMKKTIFEFPLLVVVKLLEHHLL